MAICCTRCGEELTAPKFHDGRPYGFSCYEVITGGKKSKDKRRFVKVDPVDPIPETGYFSLRVSYQGKVYQIGGVLRDANGGLHSQLAEFGRDGEIYLVTHDRKGSPIWKSIP